MFISPLINWCRIALIRRRLRRALQGIFATKPLRAGDGAFTVLSMVQHSDIAAYLVAIKSFAAYLQPRRIVVVCDPTITPEDERLLKLHIPHVELDRAEAFRHPDLPIGGTWERLYALAHIATTDYAIQLDSDTVTLAVLPEIFSAIEQRRGFVLNGFLPGDDDDDEPANTVVTIEQASSYAHRWPPKHVQALAEQRLIHAELLLPKYVRGCSGFTGLPPNQAYVDQLISFSQKMQRQLGTRWTEWGSEQVASNYLVANAMTVQLLPMPAYSASGPSLVDHRFIHFIGPTRFANRNYEKAVKQVIQKLRQP